MIDQHAGGDEQPRRSEPGGATWPRLPGAYKFPFGPPAASAERESTREDISAAGPGGSPSTASEADGIAAPTVLGRFRDAFGRLSLRARIAMLATIGVGLAVAATSIAAYFTVRAELYSSRDENLFVRARSVVGGILGRPGQLASVPVDVLEAADINIGLITDTGETYVAQGGSNGEPPAAKAPPFGRPELAVARGLTPQSIRTATTNGIQYRVVAVSADPHSAFVLAQPTAQTEQTLDQLRLVLLLVGGLGIAGATAGGLAIARAGLRPVERLTAAAEHVAVTEELEPIEVRGDDELARLARSFNEMLAALKRSRERQQQLVADAGHELRTPLTSLRTNIDLLVQSSGRGGLSAGDRAELLADIRAQSEELTILVQDLVELARDDQPGSQAEELDFAEVCERAVDRIKRRAPDVTFEVKLAPWTVHGDATALERAVVNILDNAAKWSPPHGTVQVGLDGGELRVVDQGPGIPDADLPHVFERFYRTSDARRLPGSGLGLAIVKQVAERHGGSVEVAPAETGGTQITFRLPADR